MKIELPFPLTLNGLYSTDWKTKRRFKSKRYAEWTRAAQEMLASQKTTLITGEVEIEIMLTRPDNRRRDVANYEKAVTDFLVDSGILEDDCLIERNTQTWTSKEPVRGGACSVIILPYS